MNRSLLTTPPWRQLLNLGLLAVRNPAQTWRLLNLERVKNLYITLFRQPPTARSSIFGFYETLYREQNGQSQPGTPDLTPVSVPVLLDFPTASSDPQVSIIVPAANQYETTVHCLAAVLQNTGDIDYEVLLADDASDDATRDIQKRVRNIRILSNENNLGFVDNCNRAARQAHGQFLVFLNNDTLVQTGWLEVLLATLTNESDVGLVGPQLCYPDGRLQEAGGIVWRDGNALNYGRGKDPQCPEYCYAKDVDYISGACICIRRGLWEAIGGFDTRYRPAYYEDTDLAFAVREQGYRVAYRPRSRVFHVEGASHGRDESNGVKRFQEINRGKFLNKWHTRLAEQYPDASHLFRARLFIAPLRNGADIKGKVLKALRLQVPVVTTSVGAEGLPEHDQRYLSVADTAEAFAKALLTLYNDSVAWRAQRQQGRLVFNQHFTPAAAARVLGQDIRLAAPTTEAIATQLQRAYP